MAPGRYAATLAARVGPVADTYRGDFSIHDGCSGSQLRVRIGGRGRFGRLEVDLDVSLAGHHDRLHDRCATTRTPRSAAWSPGSGNATLTVAGGHLTGCFFRDLDRALRHASRAGRVAALVVTSAASPDLLRCLGVLRPAEGERGPDVLRAQVTVAVLSRPWFTMQIVSLFFGASTVM